MRILSHDGRQASNCYAFSMLLLLLLRLWLRNLYVFPLCGVELKGNMYMCVAVCRLSCDPHPLWRGLYSSIFPDHVPNGCRTKKFVFVLMQFRDRTAPMACNFLLQGLCVWQGNRFPPTARSHYVGSYRCRYEICSGSITLALVNHAFPSRLMHNFQVHQGRVSSEIITCTSGLNSDIAAGVIVLGDFIICLTSSYSLYDERWLHFVWAVIIVHGMPQWHQWNGRPIDTHGGRFQLWWHLMNVGNYIFLTFLYIAQWFNWKLHWTDMFNK